MTRSQEITFYHAVAVGTTLAAVTSGCVFLAPASYQGESSPTPAMSPTATAFKCSYGGEVDVFDIINGKKTAIGDVYFCDDPKARDGQDEKIQFHVLHGNTPDTRVYGTTLIPLDSKARHPKVLKQKLTNQHYSGSEIDVTADSKLGFISGVSKGLSTESNSQAMTVLPQVIYQWVKAA